MYIPRTLDLTEHLKQKSILLLGPHRTGKSSYIQHQVKPDLYLNLLDSNTFSKFTFKPSLLREMVQKNNLVCVDEIQKLPNLMDEIHSLIETNKKLRFVLTGSSAKKIKKSHTSLMAGRARQFNFLPFSYNEIKNKNFDLKKFLLYGALPDVYLSKNPWDELKDYAGTYLKEEIQESAFVRKIENYARFLEFSALSSGKLLNFESLANDAFIPARTIKDYYQLLEETLIGYTVSPLRKKGSRKEISTSKFYFFDTGVLNSFVQRKQISEKSPEFGDLFEHFIFLELKHYQLTNRFDWEIEFWRTHSKDEVDFVLGKGEVLIEVKASEKIKLEHLIGINKYCKDYKYKKAIIIYMGDLRRNEGDVEIYPWSQFLEELWAGEII